MTLCIEVQAHLRLWCCGFGAASGSFSGQALTMSPDVSALRCAKVCRSPGGLLVGCAPRLPSPATLRWRENCFSAAPPMRFRMSSRSLAASLGAALVVACSVEAPITHIVPGAQPMGPLGDVPGALSPVPDLPFGSGGSVGSGGASGAGGSGPSGGSLPTGGDAPCEALGLGGSAGASVAGSAGALADEEAHTGGGPSACDGGSVGVGGGL